MAEFGHVVSTDGTRIHFEIHGRGETIVLLHGLACGRAMWNPVVDLLTRAGKRVVTVDLRGHGDSTDVLGGYELAQLADDMRLVLAALDGPIAALVGHSAGGIQAIAFASALQPDDPILPRKVVTVGTSLSLDRLQERAVLWFASSRAFYGMLATPGVGRALVSSHADDAAVQSTLAAARSVSRTVKRAWVRSMAGQSYIPLADAVPTKLVFAAGAEDTAFSSARLRSSIHVRADRQIVETSGTGHMLPLEQPQAVVDVIVDA